MVSLHPYRHRHAQLLQHISSGITNATPSGLNFRVTGKGWVNGNRTLTRSCWHVPSHPVVLCGVHVEATWVVYRFGRQWESLLGISWHPELRADATSSSGLGHGRVMKGLLWSKGMVLCSAASAKRGFAAAHFLCSSLNSTLWRFRVFLILRCGWWLQGSCLILLLWQPDFSHQISIPCKHCGMGGCEPSPVWVIVHRHYLILRVLR